MPRALVASLALVAALAPAARAEGIIAVADAVAAAHSAGDAARVRDLAAREVDLWLVAEHLLTGGHEQAAAAVAAAAPPSARNARLGAYVTWRREHPLSAADAETTHRIARLFTERRYEEALALMPAEEPATGGVTRARRLRLKARLFAWTRRPRAEVAAAHRAASDAAFDIGWVATGLTELNLAMNSATLAEAHEQVIELADAVLGHAEDLQQPAFRVHALSLRARAHHALGRHEAALADGRAAVAAGGSLRARRDALRTLASIEVGNSLHRAAREHLVALHALQRELDDVLGMAATDVHIAVIDATFGRLAAAVTRIEKALAYFEAHGTPRHIHGAHVNAASLYLLCFDPARCLEHLARAAEQDDGSDPKLAANRLPFTAGAYLQHGRWAEAVKALEAYLPALARAAPAERIAIRCNLASALRRLGRHEEALGHLRRARALLPEDATLSHTFVVGTENTVHLDRGDFDAVIAATTEVLERYAGGLHGHWEAVLEKQLAAAYLAQGDPQTALASAERSIGIVVGLSSLLPDQVGAQYRTSLADCFRIGVEAAAACRDAGRLFAVAEQAAAVALRSHWGAGELLERAVPPALGDLELAFEEAEALAMRRYRKALAALDPGTADAAATRAARLAVREAFASVTQARTQLERHRERIRAAQAVAGQVLRPEVDGLAATQAALAPDEALVVYAAGVHAWALVATRDRAHLVDLGPRAALERHVADTVLEDAGLPADAALGTLADALVEPLTLPAAVRRVRVVPAGRLALAPFAALWPERDVVLLPSSTVGRMLAQQPDAPRDAVLAVGVTDGGLAAPLPEAAPEARAVGDTVLVDEAATEAAFLSTLASAHWRAVHLACHGLIDTRHPLRSALALRPSADHDGLWTASEVLGTRIETDLVTLSACSSARGRVYEQDGVLGFVHAFFVAGAKRVLVSLWDVDDAATAALMKHFYAAWTPETDAASALRQAQAALRSEPRWQHPAWWAGWQLWGVP